MKTLSLVATIFLALVLVSCKNTDLEQKKESNSQSQAQVEKKPSEIKASFAIFTNGTFRVFTNPKYHNQSQDAFITGENPNVVTVTKIGTTWQNFFDTLHLTLSENCLTTGTNETFCNNASKKLRLFLNGEEKDGVLSEEIRENDKLLVTYTSKGVPVENELEKIPSTD